MKKCFQCDRTYYDETLSFCLADGSLLSAPFNPKETRSPTLVTEEAELETKIVSSPLTRPAISQTGVRWYVYLTGFIGAFFIYFFAIRFLFEYYFALNYSLFDNLSFENPSIFVSLLFISFNSLISGITGILLGFIWPQAGWKWGLVIIGSHLIHTLIFWLISGDRGYFSLAFPAYMALAVLAIAFFVGCLFSYLGSVLSRIIFKKSGV